MPGGEWSSGLLFVSQSLSYADKLNPFRLKPVMKRSNQDEQGFAPLYERIKKKKMGFVMDWNGRSFVSGG